MVIVSSVSDILESIFHDFQQELSAINSNGDKVGFSNEPTSLSNYSNTGYTEGSYYEVYPGRKPDYEDSGATE